MSCLEIRSEKDVELRFRRLACRLTTQSIRADAHFGAAVRCVGVR